MRLNEFQGLASITLSRNILHDNILGFLLFKLLKKSRRGIFVGGKYVTDKLALELQFEFKEF